MTIILGLWLLSVTLAVVVLLASTYWQRMQRVGGELAGGLLFASLPLVVMSFATPALAVVAVIVQAWLLVLPARLTFGRLERQFLLTSTRTNLLVAWLAATVLTLVQLWNPDVQLGQLVIVLGTTAGIGVGVFFFGQLWWNTRRYRLSLPEQTTPLKNMPTVSVCIPARNEDHALADCLSAVLASDYPKLEVLVLDDCSQDTTSSIIRSFAHDGVRFIQGETPAMGWLGKNQAMQTLAQQASGEMLLFIGVDTHVSTQSISRMVQYMQTADLDMLSVLPQNRLGLSTSTMFGTLEYFWRLTLPITRRRMPTASQCWLVTTSGLRHLGGFASVSRKVVPEESFARRLAERSLYRFLVSDAALGVTTAKRWSSQVETSIRLLYPRLQRQPLAVCATCVLVVGLFIAPFVVAVWFALAGNFNVEFWLAVAALFVAFLNYYAVLVRVQPKGWLIAGLMWPVVVAQEIALFIASMVQYEFGEVNWKGRNVCYPVLAPEQMRRGQGFVSKQSHIA